MLVSENGRDDRSRGVLARFPSLPLRYMRQDPPLDPREHLRVVMAAATGEVIALIHDDDWWAPDHLAQAVAGFAECPGAAAVIATPLVTPGPAHPFAVYDSMLRLAWLAAGCDFARPTVTLDEVGVMMACLLDTTFHYSAVVAAAPAMRAAAVRVGERDNPYDSDRQFAVDLAAHGPIVYRPHPTVYVRRHGGQACLRPEFQRRHWELMAETTRRLAAEKPKLVAEAAARFNALVPDRRRTNPQLPRVHTGPPAHVLTTNCGFDLARPRWTTRRLVSELCPPAVLAFVRRLW